MKIVSIVGRKNTGKTSLTVKVIEELTKRGYNVASIKHSHHTMEMDRENTDTWKHKQAGSNVVVGIGSTTFFNVRKEMDLNRLLFLIKHLDNVDYVVIEGFKKYNYPKIATSPDVVDEYTIAEVDSFTIDEKGVRDLADLIEKRSHDIVDTLFANNCGFNDGPAIAKEIRSGNLTAENLDDTYSYLSIDGHVVGLNRFVSDYLRQITLGVINTLNLNDFGVEKIENIELIIPGENEQKPKKGNVTVMVNAKPLEINDFSRKIIANTIRGMVSSLKTSGEVKAIDITMTGIISGDVTQADILLKTNGEDLEINEFTRAILKETTYAVISSFKTEEISEIRVLVEE